MKKRRIAWLLTMAMVLGTTTGCSSTEDLKNAMQNMGATKSENLNTNTKSLKEALAASYGETDASKKAWLDNMQSWCETNHQKELKETADYTDEDTSESLTQKCESMVRKGNALLNTLNGSASEDEHEHDFWLVYDAKETIAQPSYNENITIPAVYDWITEEDVLVKQKEQLVSPEEYTTETGFILPYENTKEHETLYADIYEPKLVKKHAKQMRTIHHAAEYRWEWVDPVLKKVTYKKGDTIKEGDSVFDHYEEPVWQENDVPAKNVEITYPEYGTYTMETIKDTNLVYDNETYAKCYCGAVIKYDCLEAHRQAYMLANMFESTPIGIYDPVKKAAYHTDKATLDAAHNGYMTFTTLDVDKSALERIIYANYTQTRPEQKASITVEPAHKDYNRIKAGKNVYRKATAADVKTFDKDTTMETGEVQTPGYWKKIRTKDAWDETIEICPEWTEWSTSRNKDEMEHRQLVARTGFTETITGNAGSENYDWGEIRTVTKEAVYETVDLPENEWYYEHVTYETPKQIELKKETSEVKFYDAVTEFITEPKCWACSHPGCKETRTYDPENPAPPMEEHTEKEDPAENPDQTEAAKVINLINEIGDVTYDDTCKEKIDAARTAYDQLTSAQQVLVTNYGTLTDTESTYETLKTETDGDRTEEEKAAEVEKQIQKINAVTFSPETKTQIDSARNAYDGLDATAKQDVTSIGMLENTEKDYETLKAEIENVRTAFEQIIEHAPKNSNDKDTCACFFQDIENTASKTTSDATVTNYLTLLKNTAESAGILIGEQNNENIEKYRTQLIGMINGFLKETSDHTWSKTKDDLIKTKCDPKTYDETFMEWVSRIEIYAMRNHDATLKSLAEDARIDYPGHKAVDTIYEKLLDDLVGAGSGSLEVEPAKSKLSKKKPLSIIIESE